MDSAPSDLTGTEQSVAMALANYASDDGGHAFPSIKKLAEITHWSERTVQSALRVLTEKGVIEVEREATNKLPAMYCFPAFRGAYLAPQERNAGGASVAAGGADDASRGAAHAVRGAGAAPKPLVNRQEEPPEEPLEGARVAPPKAKRATAMHEDWFPDPTLWHWTSVEGFMAADVDRELAKFRDHFTATGKPMKDWGAAFKNWMRRSREWGPARASPGDNGVDFLAAEGRLAAMRGDP